MNDGIHLDVSRPAYDELSDRKNYSSLKLLDRSPLHYKFAIDERDKKKEQTPDEQSDTLVGGQLTHTLALEPHLFESTYAVWRKVDGRRDARSDLYKKFLANAALGRRVIVTDEQLEHSKAMAAAIRSSPSAAPYIVGGHREVTVLWNFVEPQLGALDGWTMPLRCRIDYVTDAAMIDLKSAASAKPEDFQRQAWNLGYFAQAAMQLDGFTSISRRIRPYLWLVVESQPPYACALYEPDPDLLRLGRERYQGWLRTLRVCEETGEYPSYTTGVMQLSPPRWALPRDEEVI